MDRIDDGLIERFQLLIAFAVCIILPDDKSGSVASVKWVRCVGSNKIGPRRELPPIPGPSEGRSLNECNQCYHRGSNNSPPAENSRD